MTGTPTVHKRTSAPYSFANGSAPALPSAQATDAASSTPSTLWTWGRAKNYRLGREVLNYDSRVPESVRGFENVGIASAACGGGHTAVALRDARLLVFGYSQYGQLGLGDRSDTYHPTQVFLPPSPRALAAAESNASAVEAPLQQGGGEGGGRGVETTMRQADTAGSQSARVAEVCCGRYHTIARSADGAVYTWGGGKNGRLGHGDEKIRLVPGRVEALQHQNAMAVTAGYHNNLVLTEQGDVWSWGWGAHGQLGLGDTLDREVPTVIDELSGLGVSFLACGDRHSFAVTTDGAVLGWGSNEFDQLGTGRRGDTLLSPTPIPALAGLVVIGLSCGDRHSAAVTNLGAVYTWGCGTDGQCGHGDVRDVARPCLVAALAKVFIVSVHCGHNFTMALARNGSVYAWGNNTYGQLGNMGNTKSALPVRVQAPVNGRVSAIACAHFHACLITEPVGCKGPVENDDEEDSADVLDGRGLASMLQLDAKAGNGDAPANNKPSRCSALADVRKQLSDAGAHYKAQIAHCSVAKRTQSRDLVLADILRLSSTASKLVGYQV